MTSGEDGCSQRENQFPVDRDRDGQPLGDAPEVRLPLQNGRTRLEGTMRLILLLLVGTHLLLRGVATPYAHDSHVEAPEDVRRLHIHLSDHGHHHDGHGEHRHHNAVPRHHGPGHHDETSDPFVCHDPVQTPSDCDHDALYLDDGLILVAGEPASLWHAGTDWCAVPTGGVENAAPVLQPEPRRVRPPGDGGPVIHRFLPHVLRV